MIVKCYNVPYTLLTLRREYNLHLIVFHFVQWCHVSNSFGDDDTDKLPRKQIIGGCHSTNKCRCICLFLFINLLFYFTYTYICERSPTASCYKSKRPNGKNTWHNMTLYKLQFTIGRMADGKVSMFEENSLVKSYIKNIFPYFVSLL